MSILEILKEELSEIERSKQKLLNKALVFYSDKSIDINERWRIFQLLSNHMDYDSCYITLSFVESYYDELHCDKYKTFHFSSIDRGWGVFESMDDKEWDIAREEIMACGYGGCINNW